jgi:hypothetical protein
MIRHASGALLLLVVFAGSGCVESELDGRAELPDTIPVTGTTSDLPDGRPLPPETAPTGPEGAATGSSPF